MSGIVENKPHKESWYQARIIKWLKEAYPAAFVWKAAAGPYCRQGIPDICMVLDGQFYGFEVKRPEVGRLSRIQEQTIKEIAAAGGIVGVVSYPEDVERMIKPPSNDPLTLEELRGMEGEPVWIARLDAPKNSRYQLIDGYNLDVLIFRGEYGEHLRWDEMGKTWLAYRRKPEEV